MSHRSKTRFALLFVCLCVLSACAGIPVQEMSDARQAIQAAREAGAESHSQDKLQKAEQHLEDAKQALEQGEYKRARLSANAAKAEAMQAQKTSLSSGD